MIYIVTPCLNAVNTLEQTILSVITQAGDFDLTYHIQDGGSTDGSLKLITRWKALIKSGLLPIQCRSLTFTYSSTRDASMYEGIAVGFSEMQISDDAFMTWINGDDILMPGALALISKVYSEVESGFISWIGGAASVIRNDIPIVQITRTTPTEVIAAGLCDGKHWDFVQQEGVFFRKWLWDKVNANTLLRDFKYAGDWNLWRLFSKHSNYIHHLYPLGSFRKIDGQASQVHREAYFAEIDGTVRGKQRDYSFRQICKDMNLTQRILKINYMKSGISIVEKSAVSSIPFYFKRYFKYDFPYSLPPASELSKETVLFYS